MVAGTICKPEICNTSCVFALYEDAPLVSISLIAIFKADSALALSILSLIKPIIANEVPKTPPPIIVKNIFARSDALPALLICLLFLAIALLAAPTFDINVSNAALILFLA